MSAHHCGPDDLIASEWSHRGLIYETKHSYKHEGAAPNVKDCAQF